MLVNPDRTLYLDIGLPVKELRDIVRPVLSGEVG